MSDSSLDRFSPLVLARIVGIVSLIGIATGAFDIGYVRNALVVDGNAAATAHNILAHQTLFRFGFTAHIVLLLCNIPDEVISFILFRRVNAVIAGIAMGCGLVGTAIEGLDMLSAYVPLQVMSEGSALGMFAPQQLQTMSYLSMQLQNVGLLISFVFYGLDEMLAGYLIFRSRFLPRVLGILLGLAGFSYFTDGFTSFLAPSLNSHLMPYLLFPCLPGEGLYALWLAIKGVNVAKWWAWAAVQPEGLESLVE
ncbi:DUF4386 domain-containing protein [Dyella psychrodurans]|uniref:DUF4386 domain-containing protein n=1 Tax=Dyella psychrodurans TaxID=1927960 RepID=A0A370WW79_9GAMM|nr:DUF4386 domain-containing protein [Dyella psychrodurans]RDS80384.1 DUF4386 domain-containing protein [Dyella psychrodurans]